MADQQPATEEWISLRELARRLVVTLPAVQKAIKSGRVTAVKRDDRSGRLKGVEFHQARAQWAANTDPGQAIKSGTAVGSETAPQQEAAAAASSDAASSGAASAARAERDAGKKNYLDARTSREQVELELSRLELAKEAGALVSLDEQRQVSARRYRAIRDQLRSIPERVADLFAAETDAAKIRAALLAEIDQVLHGLAESAQAERDASAGGAGANGGSAGSGNGGGPGAPGPGVAAGGDVGGDGGPAADPAAGAGERVAA